MKANLKTLLRKKQGLFLLTIHLSPYLLILTPSNLTSFPIETAS